MHFTPRIQNRRKRFVQAVMRFVFGPGRPVERSRRLPRTGIHKILVCRTVHTLGDSLTLTPLLQELSEIYPGAVIDIVNGSPVAPGIYGHYFSVRRIFQLPVHAARHPLRTLRAIHEMRQDRYDLVIDPDPESQSGRMLTLLANATFSVGFASSKKSGNLTHEVTIPAEPRHKGTMPVHLIRSAIGDTAEGRDYPQLGIQLTAAERRQGRRMLDRLNHHRSGTLGCKGSIGIYAFATGNKNLGGAWWERFLRAFEPAVADYSLVEILPAFGYSPLGSRYPGLFSSDIRKLASVLANLTLYISADCGIMHLASAAGTRTVGIFTVTSIGEWGPYGGRNRAIDALGLAPEQVAADILATLGLHMSPVTNAKAPCENAPPRLQASSGV